MNAMDIYGEICAVGQKENELGDRYKILAADVETFALGLLDVKRNLNLKIF